MVEEADVPGVNHLSQANDKHYQIMLYQVHLAMSGIRTHDFSSWLWVAARKDATEPRVPISYVEVITLKVLDSRPYVCHGYVPFVLDSRPYVCHGYVPFVLDSRPYVWHGYVPFVLDSRPYVCHGYVPFVLDSRPYVWHEYVSFVLDSRPYVCHGYVPFVLDSRPYVWHGYVPFIVIIIRSFPKSWHITRYVTSITLRVQHVE